MRQAQPANPTQAQTAGVQPSNNKQKVETLKGNHILPVLAGILLLCCCTTCDSSYSILKTKKITVTKNTMFGITLQPEAALLLREIETLYKKEVKEIITDKDTSIGAEATIEMDGTPVVKVNKNGGITEVNIVHELWHLFRDAQTDPIVKWGGDKWALVPSITEALMTDLYQLVYDPIIHTTFYPKMRKMGYQPDINEVIHISNIISFPPPEINLLGGATTYFKAFLEIEDEELKKRLEAWYIRYNLEPHLNKGKELVKVFRTINPDTPEKRVDVYLKCLNILLEGLARFEVYQWQEVKQGEILRREVYISILPPN